MGELSVIPQTVRSIFGITLVLGVMLALSVWIFAPLVVPHIADSHSTPASECLSSLRIASLLVLVRAIESVFVSVQRAFEEYRATVQISTAVRLLTLATAAILALLKHGTVGMLAGTAVFLVTGTYLQFRQARKFVGTNSLWPRFQPAETRFLLRRGVFVWVQALGSVVFGQFDRILLGSYLGAMAVVPYTLCVQFAHPIFGLTASSLNFLFPYLSGRASTVSAAVLNRTLLKAFACNLIMVACAAGMLLGFGNLLIRIWAGAAVAQSASHILAPIVLGSALMGLSVTGTYAMQALGHFQTVAYVSLIGRTAMLLLMIDLLRHQGIHGLAVSRLCYGSVALLVYLPLLHQLATRDNASRRIASLAIACEAQEGSKS